MGGKRTQDHAGDQVRRGSGGIRSDQVGLECRSVVVLPHSPQRDRPPTIALPQLQQPAESCLNAEEA